MQEIENIENTSRLKRVSISDIGNKNENSYAAFQSK